MSTDCRRDSTIEVRDFESRGIWYRATLYSDLRFTVEVRDAAAPFIDITALPNGVDKYMVCFPSGQREDLLDLMLRAWRRGYEQGYQDGSANR